MISRRPFGAYDPDVWTAQTYLADLGFDPGTVDGLWGPNTRSAATAFRTWAGIGAASGTSQGAVMDDAFFNALLSAANAVGYPGVTPPGFAPGGSGTSPTVADGTGQGTTVVGTRPAASAGSAVSGVLPLAILGLGLVFVFGKHGRRG